MFFRKLDCVLRRIPFIKRLYPSLWKKLIFLTTLQGYKVKNYDGFLLLLNFKNAVDYRIGVWNGFERAQVEFFLNRMKDGCDAFIDVGANFGLYSLQVAKSRLAAEIHAFEPDGRNYAQLLGNLYLNKWTNKIRTYPIALSSQGGELDFCIYPEMNTGMTHVAPKSEATITLNAIALDDVFSFQDKKIFLKIDIEGHELEALKGAVCLLTNNECFLQIECWDKNAEAVKKYLKGLGYEVCANIAFDYYFAKNKAMAQLPLVQTG